jgi:hypothetical protein
MATFHGFKITRMKSWTGREGIGTSGNLVWNGRKLGEFVDYGDGGAPVYRFPTKELEAAIASQVPEVGSLDSLVAKLADMTETEKWLRQGWRKASKAGRVLASASDGEGNLVSCSYDPANSPEVIAFSLRQNAYKQGFDPDTTEVVVWDKRPELDEGTKVVSKEATKAVQEYQEKVAKHMKA